MKGERLAGTLATAPGRRGKPAPDPRRRRGRGLYAAGPTFAVVRSKGFGAESTLEYPPGRCCTGRRDHCRARGSRATEGTWPSSTTSPGSVRAGAWSSSTADGRVVHRTNDWANARGLAWAPRGGELWFTASATRSNRSLRALRLDGRQRLVLESAGSLTIRDTADDGRVLLTREDERTAVVGVPPGGTSERDLSWFDNAGLAAVSDDGRMLLFGDRFGILAPRHRRRARHEARHGGGSPGRSLARRKDRARHEPDRRPACSSPPTRAGHGAGCPGRGARVVPGLALLSQTDGACSSTGGSRGIACGRTSSISRAETASDHRRGQLGSHDFTRRHAGGGRRP